jgi:protein-S-isoprenylcysteine O-methyltransferase Ste14
VSCLWGMARHFRRVGKPTGAMAATGLLAAALGVLQLVSIGRGDRMFPIAGLVLYCVSASLFWWAVSVTRGKLAACGQGCVSGAILRKGPYRLIRHPFYVSYNLMWIAGFAATGWWVLIVSAAVMACLYDGFARAEERGFIESSLAGEYREYQLATGRYWPRF